MDRQQILTPKITQADDEPCADAGRGSLVVDARLAAQTSRRRGERNSDDKPRRPERVWKYVVDGPRHHGEIRQLAGRRAAEPVAGRPRPALSWGAERRCIFEHTLCSARRSIELEPNKKLSSISSASSPIPEIMDTWAEASQNGEPETTKRQDKPHRHELVPT